MAICATGERLLQEVTGIFHGRVYKRTYMNVCKNTLFLPAPSPLSALSAFGTIFPPQPCRSLQLHSSKPILPNKFQENQASSNCKLISSDRHQSLAVCAMYVIQVCTSGVTAHAMQPLEVLRYKIQAF